MLKQVLSTLALLASAALAQSPLNTNTGANNQGNAGNGLYFDLQITSTVTITQLETAIGDTTYITAAGNALMEIWLGPSTYLGNVTNASLWTPVATANAPIAVGTAGIYPQTVFTLATPLCLGPGNYGVALKSSALTSGGNVAWNLGYHNGAGCTSTTIPGSCPNSLFTNSQMTFRGGAAQNAFLTGSIFTPRVFNGQFIYTLGGTPVAVAGWEKYGIGCNRSRTSFHEIFPNPGSTDISNTTVTMGVGPTSAVTVGGTAFTAPSGTATTITFPTSDANVLATTVLGGPLPVPILYNQGGSLQLATDLEINADGYISPVPSSVLWGAPLTTTFYSSGPRWCPHWKNMDVIGGGNITMEVEASGALVVSWNGVKDTGAANTGVSTFQIAFLANGSVEYRYGAISVGGGGTYPVIIGWSQGANAMVNEVDISTVNFVTGLSDNAEMSQIMTARPRLGTTPSFVADNLSGAPFGVSMLDFVQDNTSLASFGAPSCTRYNTWAVAQIVFPSGSPATITQSFPIPNSTAFNGLLVYSQMAAFAPTQNQLGIIFSDGVRMFMGSL